MNLTVDGTLDSNILSRECHCTMSSCSKLTNLCIAETWADREGGARDPDPPKNRKNIGFPSKY